MKYTHPLLLSMVHSNKIIKNANYPSCKNCIYYKPSIYNNDFVSTFNKCQKFGEKNIVTDEISYTFADSCRNDDSKCGKEGKYFEEEKNINMKILYYGIISNTPYILYISIVVSYIIFLSKK